MSRVIKIFILSAFVFAEFSCSKEPINLGVLSKSKIEGYFDALTVKVDGQTKTYRAIYEETELTGFSLDDNGVVKNYTFLKDDAGAITGYAGADQDTVKYTIGASGLLRSIQYPDARLERTELNSIGKWEYYYREKLQNGNTIYEEIRNFVWENGDVKKLISNKPSASYEEETYQYTQDVNPFQLLKSAWPMHLGFEAYLISAHMPLSSARTFAGENLRFSSALTEDGKFSTFTIEKQSEGNSTFSEYITYTASYH